MAKCRCEESRELDPRWRVKNQKPSGKGYEYKVICLACGFEWWSKDNRAHMLPPLSTEEVEKLGKEI